MRALQLKEFADYHFYLKAHPEELKKFLEIVTINLSYFFRNKETFDYICDHVFPNFKKDTESITLWSAGCARGEEPYSLAIAAAESSLLGRVMVYGSDIDESALADAEKGEYAPVAFQYTPKSILVKYFEHWGENYVIGNRIRNHVKFRRLDLFEKPTFGLCNLIMCRNVLIYLDRKAQSTVLKTFYERLKPDGYLIIGKVELLIGIPEMKLFNVINRTEHIYKKVNT
jgi:chemotaxis methyl-accepting protein methylase